MQVFGRAIARFAILVPGLIIAYFGVDKILPYFNNKLPVGLAILFTYILCAYILAPALLRIFRIIKTPVHLPIYSITPDGLASDPINISIIATRRQLIRTMEKAGWHMADPHTIHNIFKMGISILFNRTYKNAPMSSLYMFGRKQDIAFEIPIGSSAGERHHVRFWATTYDMKKKNLDVKGIHWHNRRSHVFGDSLLWVGAASLDNGVALIRHNLQFTHMIHPDTNLERDMIVSQLKTQKLLDKVTYIKLGSPYKLVNRVINGYLHTDGKMALVNLKEPKRPTGLRSRNRSR